MKRRKCSKYNTKMVSMDRDQVKGFDLSKTKQLQLEFTCDRISFTKFHY